MATRILYTIPQELEKHFDYILLGERAHSAAGISRVKSGLICPLANCISMGHGSSPDPSLICRSGSGLRAYHSTGAARVSDQLSDGLIFGRLFQANERFSAFRSCASL